MNEAASSHNVTSQKTPLRACDIAESCRHVDTIKSAHIYRTIEPVHSIKWLYSSNMKFVLPRDTTPCKMCTLELCLAAFKVRNVYKKRNQ